MSMLNFTHIHIIFIIKKKYTKKIDTLNIEQINNDFSLNKNIVSDKYFAFPYGATNENIINVLKKNNVSLAFGYNQNRNMTINDDQYLLPRYLMFSEMPMFYFKWITQ